MRVRGLRALGISSASYGGLLSPILVNKLPPELRVVSRELKEDEWEFESIMKIVVREVEARERPAAGSTLRSRKPTMKLPHTALSLTTGTSPQGTCAYCSQDIPEVPGGP